MAFGGLSLGIFLNIQITIHIIRNIANPFQQGTR